MEMENMTRISITLPTSLLKEFNQALKEMRYPNRSKAIQDAILSLLTEHKWSKVEEGDKAGVIIIFYDHDKPGVIKKINDIQHYYRNIIISSSHFHLDEHNCLETITVKGRVPRLRKLTQELKTKKGVKIAKLLSVVS
jgi:CopG family nickel-responsive transcriptional regulator